MFKKWYKAGERNQRSVNEGRVLGDDMENSSHVMRSHWKVFKKAVIESN